MNYLKMFVKNHRHDGARKSMSHFWEDQTRDISKVNGWFEEGSKVSVIFSVNQINSEVTEITEVKELESGEICIRTIEGEYDNMPWDDQKRRIRPRFFLIDDCRGYTLEEAKEAVLKGGHAVQVEDRVIRTGTIVEFISENTFMTSSGSIYEIV